MAMLTKEQARRVWFPGEPIQWHLPVSTYDRCPRCGSKLALLGRDRRTCLSDLHTSDQAQEDANRLTADAFYTKYGACLPGTVWESQLTPLGFITTLIDGGAKYELITPKTPWISEGAYACGWCQQGGHNIRTCPTYPTTEPLR